MNGSHKKHPGPQASLWRHGTALSDAPSLDYVMMYSLYSLQFAVKYAVNAKQL